MKKAMIISDTHGAKAAMAAVVRRFGDIDMIIHLGDYSRDAAHMRTMTTVPVFSVRGNCDVGSSAKAELLLCVEGVRILAVHGHRQNVKRSLLGLALYAQEKQAALALFGHTHRSAEQVHGGVTIYNPGSLGEPRGGHASVGMLALKDGTFSISTIRF